MPSHAAVSVNNDLATRQAAVAHGATNNELASRINMVTSSAVQPFGGKNRFNDVFSYCFVEICLRDVWIVLC